MTITSSPSSTLVRALTLLVVVLLLGLVASTWLLWNRADNLDRLSPQDRQRLAEDLIEDSPGLYRWAYFAPRIGYTLVPNTEHEAFGSPVLANELGYRTGAVQKKADTLRIVFVGDSWTFGMGVEHSESYPEQVARLANDHAGLGQTVEAWTLALPGYNTLNELAAFWYFFDRLQPDIVVLCVSGNDNHSTLSVLPNGSTAGQGLELDFYGDPLQLYYRGRWLDSYRYRDRWRQNFREIARTETRLRQQNVPLLLFFLARWQAFEAHAYVSADELESPYIVAPRELTRGRWTNQRWGHGTPEANRIYGQLVYGGLSRQLGWPSLPDVHDAIQEGDIYFESPPEGSDHARALAQVFRDTTSQYIPTSFRAGEAERVQTPGPIDLASGEMGRASSLLIRRPPEVDHLVVEVDTIDTAALYPLEVDVLVPSKSGGTRTRLTIDGPGTHTALLPSDIEVGEAIDVHLVAHETTSSPDSLASRSLRIKSIVPAGLRQ